MVTYAVRCSDQSAHDCFKTVEVDIGVPDLTPEQLAGIVARGDGSVVRTTRDPAPDTTHFVNVELDATVCAACLKDRSTEVPD